MTKENVPPSELFYNRIDCLGVTQAPVRFIHENTLFLGVLLYQSVQESEKETGEQVR